MQRRAPEWHATHLAISLPVTAAGAGRHVYYGTVAGLIDSLIEARTAGELSTRLRVLTHPALLVVDEIAVLPVSQDAAVLFFLDESDVPQDRLPVLRSAPCLPRASGSRGSGTTAAAAILRGVSRVRRRRLHRWGETLPRSPAVYPAALTHRAAGKGKIARAVRAFLAALSTTRDDVARQRPGFVVGQRGLDTGR